MAKNILKEAIADAKAVREVALANAKAALEEAFTPKLQSMLSAKLSEDLDETYYDEDEKDMEEGMHFDEDEKDMEEMMYDEDEDMEEGHMDGHGMYDEDEKDVDEMLGIAQKKNVSMREALAKVWGIDEGKSPFQIDEKKPLTKEQKDDKTVTGKKPTEINVDPKIEEK